MIERPCAWLSAGGGVMDGRRVSGAENAKAVADGSEIGEIEPETEDAR